MNELLIVFYIIYITAAFHWIQRLNMCLWASVVFSGIQSLISHSVEFAIWWGQVKPLLWWSCPWHWNARLENAVPIYHFLKTYLYVLFITEGS